MRAFGKAFVQSFFSTFSFRQFIAHGLLYLYIISKSTISKLRNSDRQFRSHPRQSRALGWRVAHACIIFSSLSPVFSGLTNARFSRSGRKNSRATALISAVVTRARRRLIAVGE